jgi:hypothetical protein
MSYTEETEDYGIIHIDSPKYGEFKVLIDLEDIDRCKKYNWNIHKTTTGKYKSWSGYYVINHEVGLLHRFIMQVTDRKIEVDHKYGNGLDNRKCNLRKCNSSENSMNQKKRKSDSGITGVLWYYYRNINKWWAYIGLNNKKISLGYYDKLEDAIEARRKGEIKYFGEYSRNHSVNA